MEPIYRWQLELAIRSDKQYIVEEKMKRTRAILKAFGCRNINYRVYDDKDGFYRSYQAIFEGEHIDILFIRRGIQEFCLFNRVQIHDHHPIQIIGAHG